MKPYFSLPYLYFWQVLAPFIVVVWATLPRTGGTFPHSLLVIPSIIGCDSRNAAVE